MLEKQSLTETVFQSSDGGCATPGELAGTMDADRDDNGLWGTSIFDEMSAESGGMDPRSVCWASAVWEEVLYARSQGIVICNQLFEDLWSVARLQELVSEHVLATQHVISADRQRFRAADIRMSGMRVGLEVPSNLTMRELTCWWCDLGASILFQFYFINFNNCKVEQ